MSDSNLFIPLYEEYFNQFKWGQKTVEYREYGPRWNEKTCVIGRRAVLSKGYGKYERMYGKVGGFQRLHRPGRKSLAAIWAVLDEKQPDVRSVDGSQWVIR